MNLLMIEKARNFAIQKHDGQVRKFCGEPYHNHVFRVASLVSKFTQIPEVIATAYLHDVIEDCNVQAEQIEYEFNMVVSALVEELTNVYTKERYPELSRKQRKIQEVIRIGKISSLAKMVKLADRLDNVLDMKKECPEDYSYYIKESRELLEVLRGVNPELERLLEEQLV